MSIINKREFNQLNAIDDVCESNKLEQQGNNFSREAQLLGGFVAESHRRRILNNKKEQAKLAYRMRKSLGFN